MDNHLVFVAEVFLEPDFHCRVAEAFVSEVFFGDLCGPVDDVLGDLVAFHKLESLLQLLAFALLHAVILHF